MCVCQCVVPWKGEECTLSGSSQALHRAVSIERQRRGWWVKKKKKWTHKFAALL